MELPRYLRAVRGAGALGVGSRARPRSSASTRLLVVSGTDVHGAARGAAAPVLSRAAGRCPRRRQHAVAEVDAPSAAARASPARTRWWRSVAARRSTSPSRPASGRAAARGRPHAAHRGRHRLACERHPDASAAFRAGTARLPIAVAVDLEVIAAAPPDRTRAGSATCSPTRSALRDWRLAAEAGARGEVDDFAALLAADRRPISCTGNASSPGVGAEPDSELLQRLLSGLVLSGLAMEIAGSSRPCSGSEHLISHALDGCTRVPRSTASRSPSGRSWSRSFRARTGGGCAPSWSRPGCTTRAAGFDLWSTSWPP